jgi:hypothetical protein
MGARQTPETPETPEVHGYEVPVTAVLEIPDAEAALRQLGQLTMEDLLHIDAAAGIYELRKALKFALMEWECKYPNKALLRREADFHKVWRKIPLPEQD